MQHDLQQTMALLTRTPAALDALLRGLPETWTPRNEGEGKTLEQLLDEFARSRAENLDELRALNLRREDLERRGRHPAFGVVTLSELLATWATHDLTHLHQISRIMAHQYREAVGPWSAYLGVLQCAGHSSG